VVNQLLHHSLRRHYPDQVQGFKALSRFLSAAPEEQRPRSSSRHFALQNATAPHLFMIL
jgi:hypothetical protein